MATESERLALRIGEKGALLAARNIFAIGKSARSTKNPLQSLQGLLTAIATAVLVRKLVNVADTFTTMQNRLKIVTSSTAELAVVTDELFQVANRTRSQFEATATVYSRAALSSRTLGISQRQLLKFTESLNQAVILSGASFREANQGLIQLSQGLASGTLRGDELRAVLEQLPFVADIIAEGMGVTRGELRLLGEQGKISAKDIFRSFKEQEGKIADLFAKTTPTIQQAFGVLENNIVRLVGRLQTSTGAASGFAEVVLRIADNLHKAAPFIDVFVGLIGKLAGRLLGRVEALGEKIKKAFQDSFRDGFEVNTDTILGKIIKFVDKVFEFMTGAAGAIVFAFEHIPGALASVFATAFNAISVHVRNFLNGVIRNVNEVKVKLGLEPIGFILKPARIDTGQFEEDVRTLEQAFKSSSISLTGLIGRVFDEGTAAEIQRLLELSEAQALLDRQPEKPEEAIRFNLDPFLAQLREERRLLMFNNEERERQEELIKLIKAAEKEGRTISPFAFAILDAEMRRNQELARQRQLLEGIKGPLREYEADVKALNVLLTEGAINQKEFDKALEELKKKLQDKKGLTAAQEALAAPFKAGKAALDEFVDDGVLKIKTFIAAVAAEFSKLALQKIFLSLTGLGLPGFQHGAAFEVGGSGGPDSQLVAFRGTPGEPVAVGQGAINQAAQGQPVLTTPPPVVNVFNIFDPNFIAEGIQSDNGTQAVLNIIRSYPETVRQAIA
jgi:tape measure domain-containing protein